MIKKLKNNKKGFTLVEIIVVLVILAIMAAIMIPGMTGWIKKAQDKSAIVEARTVLLAAQTIASEDYIEDPDATALTATQIAEVIDLAGVSGSVSSVALSDGSVTSLVYVTGDNTVTYTPAGGFVVS